ncbi:nucleoside hydrolase [Nocardia sp. NPDC057440]|uniref:nucleoside hydrolase n=1 Tax=Nocardia sp. NPDC057440 TaxID=3346134 RepID=UPI00366AE214
MTGVTVITDPGVDDMIALVLLDKLAAGRRKTLVSTYGNVDGDTTAKNGREFVSFIGGEWEFRRGADLPESRSLNRPWARNFHGDDGLWGVQPPVSGGPVRDAILERPADVISLGPLTETRSLVDGGLVESLLIMGGTIDVPGNETKWSEFNVAMDPEAGRALFRACHGIDVRLVPMDATQQVKWTVDDVLSIPETTVSNRWMKELLFTWFKNYERADELGFVLYDPLAVYLAFNPGEALWVRSGLDVITDSAQRGRTVLSDAHPSCSIAMDIFDPDATAENIFSLLFEAD